MTKRQFADYLAGRIDRHGAPIDVRDQQRPPIFRGSRTCRECGTYPARACGHEETNK